MKYQFPRITYQGQPVAYWQPDRGWTLRLADITWDTRLGRLVSRSTCGTVEQGIAEAKEHLATRTWCRENLVLVTGKETP